MGILARKKRASRYIEDEMDIDDSFPEGNPYARRRREKSTFWKIPKWVYRCILILVLCVAGLLLWFNKENLTPSNILEWIQTSTIGMGVGDGYPVKIAGSFVSPGNFVSLNKEIIVVSDTRLTILNSTAKELMSRQHSYSSPIMRTAGSHVLIFNLGGSGYQIENYSRTVKKSNARDNIQAGDIAANGRYVLVTEEKGYSSRLTAYLADHTEQYVFEFADYYVTDVALNRDGTGAAVTAVSAENGGASSLVYVLDFNNPKEEVRIAYSECLMMGVNYCEDGTIVAIGDNMASMIRAGGKEKTDYSYQGQQLTDYAVDNGRTVLALSPFSNSSTGKLVVLDNVGKTLMTADSPHEIMSASLFGDTAAFLSGNKVYGFSATSGTAIGTGDAGADAKSIVLKDEGSVYVLGVSEIRLSGLN